LATLLEQGDLSTVGHPAVAALFRALVNATSDQRRAIAAVLRETSDPTTTPGQVSALATLKEQWRALVPTFRVLCFSELKDVPPMWQHYADEYRGVVLEVSPIYEDSPFLVARPVAYRDAPPSIADPCVWVDRMLSQTGYADLFIEYQYVKTTPWSYEKEWRIVSSARFGETGLFADYGFNSRDLTGIYFGPKCSTEDRSDLLALLTHGLGHVRAYETIPDAQQARFTFQSIGL
jgi:hypothetical protein